MQSFLNLLPYIKMNVIAFAIGVFVCAFVVPNGAEYVGNKCGYVYCINQTGIICRPEQSVCECPPNYYGNGRFACINQAESSLCTLYGDPHVIQFDLAKLSVPLPCRHTVSEFETPDGCKIKITGFTEFLQDGEYPAHLFEAGFELEGQAFFHDLVAGVDKYGFFSKSVVRMRGIRGTVQPVDMLTVEDGNGFYDMNIPQCKVKASYRPWDSAINVVVPVGTIYNGGVCGSSNDSISSIRNKAAALNFNVDQYSMYTFADQMDDKYEYDTSCLSFASTMKTCNPEYKVNAVRFCAAPFYFQLFGRTMLKRMSKEKIFVVMNQCLVNFCSTGSPGSSCTVYKQAFVDYPQPSGLEEIQPFCP